MIMHDLDGNDLDPQTVDQLQLLDPSNKNDFLLIEELFEKKLVFLLIGSSQRTALRAHLNSVEGMVLSLFTFFEDLKCLEVCVNVIKTIILIIDGQSIYESSVATFVEPGMEDYSCIKIETEEKFLQELSNISKEDC